jgi:colanic acid/amylovoran biosynthesis glycosyltransferase
VTSTADRLPATEVAGRPGRVAYIMSRFPKLTETFVLNELRTLEALGARIELFPLLREKRDIEHPTVRAWVERARFSPFMSLRILQANVHFLHSGARQYFRTWLEVVRGTWGSLNFLVGAIAIFPKVVRFAYEMRQEGITHVHAHFATHPAVAAFIIHRLTGIPFSFTAHGSDLHVDRRMLDRKVDAAAFVVTISEYNKGVILAQCGEAVRPKIRVVHCGVDSDLFRPRSKPARRWLSMVCVASFEEVKGHRYLIEACRLLRDRGIDYRCDLLGEGPTRRAIEARISAAGLRDRVLVHGPKPSPEVARIVSTSDLIVLPSHPTSQGKREGIPVALMEGMACGLPVVATDISGIPELVEHGRTGFLVPPRDSVALADAIQALHGEPALRGRMGSAGREKIQEEFDLVASGGTLLQLFAMAQHPDVSAQRSPFEQSQRRFIPSS